MLINQTGKLPYDDLPQYSAQLKSLNIALVYGGASVGIMGAVADSLLEEGGYVIGVMPSFLENREISRTNSR